MLQTAHISHVSRLAKRFYPDLEGRWDDTFFRDAILQQMNPDMTVLDLGAGRGMVPQMNFRGLAKIVGVDPEPVVFQNRSLDEARIATAEHLPFPDETFELVFCNNVLEHLRQP